MRLDSGGERKGWGGDGVLGRVLINRVGKQRLVHISFTPRSGHCQGVVPEADILLQIS